MTKRVLTSTYLYYGLALVAAIVLQKSSAWIVAGLVTDVVDPSPESAMDDRISSIFQYQVWAGALLAACSAFALTRDVAIKANWHVGFYLVVICSVLSFAIGYIHFEILHYFKESGTYLREFDSNLGLLHMAQSTLLMWAVFVFAHLMSRSVRESA